MPTAPTFLEIYNLGRAEAIARRPDLTVDDGDITDMLLAAAAAMGDRAIGYAVQAFSETFISSAQGQALRDLGSDHWDLPYQEAVAATGQVSFTRVSASAGAGTIAAGTEVATEIDAGGTDYRFTTDADIVWGGAETGTKSVNVTASATGRESNVAAGTVTRIISTLFDSSFTITNAAVMAGGAPEESDEDYRQRLRDFPAAVGRGTLAALEFGAKQVASVQNATASEDVTTGEVTVYVSDVDGNATAQMLTDVQDELLNWRAGGIKLIVSGGTPTLQDVTYSITVRPGTDVAALEADITSAIQGTLNRFKIGDTLYRSLLFTAIHNVAIDNIVDVTITTPAADVAPSGNQLLRPGTITRV